MNASRITEEYENGVEEFLLFAQSKAQPMWGKFFCPCVNDVTIKILYCGICHTDLHYAKNEWGITMYPVVPG